MNFNLSCIASRIDLDLPHLIWEAISADSSNTVFLTRFLHNKITLALSNYLRCYLSYLSPEFVGGVFTVIGLALFLIGLWFIINKKNWPLLLILLASPLFLLFEIGGNPALRGAALFIGEALVMLYGILCLKKTAGQKILIFVVMLAFFLRIYNLGQTPPALYWDEASLGYNAYSISQTLRDEHGEFLPLTRFIAFGDYKAPGYIYAAAVSVKLFGLNDFAIRFPSALAGTLLVLVTYLLVSELFESFQIKNSFKISNFKFQVSLLAAALLAVSPWAIQFSRAAFEANLATFLSGAGILFFLRALRTKSSIFYILFSIFCAFSMYTFNSHRVFVPLIILALVLIFRREVFAQWKKLLVAFLLFGFLLLPLAKYSTTREAQLRFNEVSWVNDLDPIQTANNRVAVDKDVWWSKVVHNRRVSWSLQFLRHYSDQFRPDFLFYQGDVNLRLSTRAVGEMYWIELPFLLAGAYFLIRHRSKSSAVIFAWLILAPIPAAMARETPHALRTLNILPIPQIVVALGVVWSISKLPKSLKYLKFLIPILYLLSSIFYLHDYYTVYPVRSEMSWQFGYKEMVDYVKTAGKDYSCVSVTEAYGRPYIYFLLYNQYPPEKYWATRTVERDWYGFWYVHGFDKYHFGNQKFLGPCLYVRSPADTPAGVKIQKIIYNLSGQPVFQIYD